MKPKIPRKQAAAQIGDSDDFVLPVAPPPAPVGHAPNSMRAVSILPELSPSSNAADGEAPAAIEPRAVLGYAADESYPDTPDQKSPQILETPRKSAPWSLVILLVCLVVGLLFVIANKSNETPPPPSGAFSGIHESELTSGRSEAEAMRTKVEEMQHKINELAQQQEAERKVAEARFEKLLREKKALEDSTSNSIAEVDRLKRQLHSTAPKDLTPSAPPQAEPVISNSDGTTYRVTGLRPGDTLNVRSGPGVSNPVVTALQNGAKVTVTGAAVMNGPDEWLPCTLTLNGVDPATGYNRSWVQKCWINSFFIERIEN